jgi:branched-chain amino acid transport system substrate-binding protein
MEDGDMSDAGTRWCALGRPFTVGFAALLAAMALGCGGPGPAGPIVVGAIAPLTGDGAAYGKWAQRGVDLAVEEGNPPGQAARFRIQWEDSKLDPTAAVSAYLKLVDFDKVPIVIGPLTSGETRAVLPKANEKRVPILSPTATSDEFVNAGDFFFRVCPTNLVQADSAAQFAMERLHAKTAFVLFEEIAYGTDLAAAFAKRFEALGGRIAGRDSFREGATDYRALIQKVQQASPDVLYAPSNYTEAATLLRQLEQLQVHVPVVGGDGAYGDALLKLAGPAAEGTYWTTIAWGSGAAKAVAESFEQRYSAKYGEAPHQFAGLYYDAARIVFQVITRQGMTGAEVRQALLAMPPFEGATGTTKFSDKGQVAKSFAVYEVQHGKYVQVAP